MNPTWFMAARVYVYTCAFEIFYIERGYMYYTYVLQSKKDDKLYIGFSSDLKKRLCEHNDGLVVSTKHRRPFELIFYEAFKQKEDAMRREVYFKTNKGKSSLKQILRNSFLGLKE